MDFLGGLFTGSTLIDDALPAPHSYSPQEGGPIASVDITTRSTVAKEWFEEAYWSLITLRKYLNAPDEDGPINLREYRLHLRRSFVPLFVPSKTSIYVPSHFPSPSPSPYTSPQISSSADSDNRNGTANLNTIYLPPSSNKPPRSQSRPSSLLPSGSPTMSSILQSGKQSSRAAFRAGDVGTIRALRSVISNLSPPPPQRKFDKRQAMSVAFKLDERKILEETQKQLEVKAKESALAAEIGQTLLERNIHLESQLASLTNSLLEAQGALERAEAVHVENERLYNAIDVADTVEAAAIENVRLKERCAMLEAKVAEMFGRNVELEDLEGDLKEEYAARVRELQRAIAPMRSKQRALQEEVNRMDELTAEVEQMRIDRTKLREKCKVFKKKNVELARKAELLEGELETTKEEFLKNEPLKAKYSNLLQKFVRLERKVQIDLPVPGLGGLPPRAIASAFRSILLESPVTRVAAGDAPSKEEVDTHVHDKRLIESAHEVLNKLEEAIAHPSDQPEVSTSLTAHLVRDLLANIGDSLRNDESFTNSLIYGDATGDSNDSPSDIVPAVGDTERRISIYILLCVIVLQQHKEIVGRIEERRDEEERNDAELEELRHKVLAYEKVPVRRTRSKEVFIRDDDGHLLSESDSGQSSETEETAEITVNEVDRLRLENDALRAKLEEQELAGIEHARIFEVAVGEAPSKSTALQETIASMRKQQEESERMITTLQLDLQASRECQARSSSTIEELQSEIHQAASSQEVLRVHVETVEEAARGVAVRAAALQERVSDLETEASRVAQDTARERDILQSEIDKLHIQLQDLQRPPEITPSADPPILVPPTLQKDYTIAEEGALVAYLNHRMLGDPGLSHVLPIDPAQHISRAVYDGVLLCKLVNMAVPATVDERAINTCVRSDLEVEQNFNLCINSARAVGCILPHYVPEDGGTEWNSTILLRDPSLMIGLIWEIVRVDLMQHINIEDHPELLRLKSNDESLKQFVHMPPARLLLRWVNYHLAAAKSSHINNFASDLPISALAQLVSQLWGEPPTASPQWIIDTVAAHLNAFIFVDATTINLANERLNISFLATLCHLHTGLSPISADESKSVHTQMQTLGLTDSEGDREERAFCVWINSLGISTHVNNLAQDLQDGIVVLQIFDKINPHIVNWREVHNPPANPYKRLENCNMGVKLAKRLNFSLVGIDGKDFADGNRKLILALVWQACKYHLFSIIRSLGGYGGGSDADIQKWANDRVQRLGRGTPLISHFKDPSLSTGLFLIDLIESVCPGSVNYGVVITGTDSEKQEGRTLNAKYAISMARRMGCFVFCVWEDIVEVQPKMMLAFVASLMCFQKQRATPKSPIRR